MKIENIIDSILITLGLTISLSDIHTILSIIILVFNLIWISIKFIIKLIKYIKNDGKLSSDEIDDLLKDIDEAHSKIKDGDNNE